MEVASILFVVVVAVVGTWHAIPIVLVDSEALQPFVLNWRPCAIVVALFIASMKLKQEYSRLVLWIMRITAMLIALSIGSDYLAWRFHGKWPIPAIPRWFWDYSLPVIYVLLYAYFIMAARHADQSILQARNKAARTLRRLRTRIMRTAKEQVNQRLLNIEVKEKEKEQRRKELVIEDRAFSASPTQYFGQPEPFDCDINFQSKTVTMKVKIENKHTKPRVVWISASVEISRDKTKEPLFTIQLPVLVIDARANQTTEFKQSCCVTMDSEQATKAASIYAADGNLRMRLVNANLTTLINMTDEPKAVTGSLLPQEPRFVDHVYHDHRQPILLSS